MLYNIVFFIPSQGRTKLFCNETTINKLKKCLFHFSSIRREANESPKTESNHYYYYFILLLTQYRVIYHRSLRLLFEILYVFIYIGKNICILLGLIFYFHKILSF